MGAIGFKYNNMDIKLENNEVVQTTKIDLVEFVNSKKSEIESLDSIIGDLIEKKKNILADLEKLIS